MRRFSSKWARLAGSLVLAFALVPPVSAQVKEIRMVEAGGKSGESIEEGYVKPFTAKTGIKVSRESPGSLGKLQAMVESGKITAVLFELGSTTLEQAKAKGLIEPLDWKAISPNPMYPEARNDYGLGYQYYSTVMAWRADAKAPKTWVDFWNAKDFPGKRTLPDYPAYAIPAALIADGVPPDKLYPIDLDRAFKSLEKIKAHVSVWWKAGAQPPQLLKDNEVQYAISWSGRVVGQDGIAMTYNQAFIDLSYFVVPKGANPAEKAAAMKLLHEMTVAANQAKAAEVISYSGCSPELDPLLPQSKLLEFPTAKQNKAAQILHDREWWFKNAEAVQKRWEQFKLGL